MTLETLPGKALAAVLASLELRDAVALSGVSHSLRTAVASDRALWNRLSRTHFPTVPICADTQTAFASLWVSSKPKKSRSHPLLPETPPPLPGSPMNVFAQPHVTTSQRRMTTTQTTLPTTGTAAPTGGHSLHPRSSPFQQSTPNLFSMSSSPPVSVTASVTAAAATTTSSSSAQPSLAQWEAARPVRRSRSSVRTERLFDDVVSADLEEFEDWFKRSLRNPNRQRTGTTVDGGTPVLGRRNSGGKDGSTAAATTTTTTTSQESAAVPTADEELARRLNEHLTRPSSGVIAIAGSAPSAGGSGTTTRGAAVTGNGRHKAATLHGRPQSTAVVERHAGQLEDLTWGSPVATNLDFGMLLDRPDCKDIKITIDTFVRGFERQTRGNVDEEAKSVRQLLNTLEATMKARVVWSRLSPNHFVIAKEEMHKYIFAKLYPTIFVKKDYQAKDATIRTHVDKIRAVMTPQYLDLKRSFYENETLSAAVRELELLDVFVTPFEKLMCIFNCCRILIFILQTGGSSAGADDFLPLFIYVVLQADLRALQSNMEYVARYIDPEEKFGEGYCYYTHLVSAVTFLTSVQPEAVVETLKKKQADAAAEVQPPSSVSAPPLSPSPPDHDVPPQSRSQPTTSPPCEIPRSSAGISAAGVPTTGLAIASSVVIAASPTSTESTGSLPSSPACDALQSPISAAAAAGSDAAFLDGLRFLGATAERLTPTDVAQLLTEYKRLAEIARTHYPRLQRIATWGQESAVAARVLDLPAGSRVMSLLVSHGYLWCGLESGRVAIASVEHGSGDLVSSLAVHSTAVTAMVFVKASIWCGSREGAICTVDPNFLSVGEKLVLHDPSHADIASLVYAEKAGIIWSAGVAPSQAESQLVGIHHGATLPRLTVVIKGVISQLSLHRGTELWAALDDGTLLSLNAETGDRLRALGPLAPSPTGRVAMCLSSPTLEAMWVGAGDNLFVLEGDSSVAVKVETAGLCGPVRALCAAQIAWGIDGAKCGVVMSASTAGAVCLWNANDRTCEAALAGGPAFPQALSGSSTFAASPAPNGGTISTTVCAVAEDSRIYLWTFEGKKKII